ncbi:MAG: PEP-CTERM sorting domain-containing protein [Candidatus Moranbacteria bacterium]|nr:PEP-CTERM sorting domain-containing protein [bacterium]MDP1833819.1 PEP-CTERM sorting domain-containing protein [Candidatus Moranbacteria bacterium]
MMKKKIVVLALAMALVPVASQATTMLADMTADNAFSLFISTDDTQLGSLVGSGSNWMVTYRMSGIELAPGVNNYLHVVASDWGVIAGFIGDFTLSDDDFSFSNGSRYMVTDTDWNVYENGFGGTLGVLSDVGVNGVVPWGVRPNIDSVAHWLWTNDGLDTYTTRYFSAEITPTGGVAPVPEPATMLLFGSGMVGLASSRLKRKKR